MVCFMFSAMIDGTGAQKREMTSLENTYISKFGMMTVYYG